MRYGMSYKPGELVGIPFPYSDLTSENRRPVLVIPTPDRHGDFVGLAVTSVPTFESAVPIDDNSMAKGRLPRASWVHCDKIFTLGGNVVVRNYGKLKDDVFLQIVNGLCKYLGCPGV
jgi:mRNA interferase MazF